MVMTLVSCRARTQSLPSESELLALYIVLFRVVPSNFLPTMGVHFNKLFKLGHGGHSEKEGVPEER